MKGEIINQSRFPLFRWRMNMSRLLLASAIGLVVLAGGAKQMVHADREKNPKNDSQSDSRSSPPRAPDTGAHP
jgi:hypothetical protein